MEPYTLVDVFVYAQCVCWLVLLKYGIVQLLFLLAGALPFLLLELPVQVFFNYYVRTDETRLPFVRHSSIFEYCCVECMRWIQSNLNNDIMGRQLLFSKTVCTWIFQYRRLRYGTEELGDTNYQNVETDLFNGYWVTSKCCAQQFPGHDLVVFFIPGNAFGFTSSYAYVEFLCLMQNSLMEEGFENPAIFCVDIDWQQGYIAGMNSAIVAWEYVRAQCPGSVKVMMGDGVGATAAVVLLQHSGHPLHNLCAFYAPESAKPDAAVLISPLLKLAKTRVTNLNDYVTNNTLMKFARRSISEHDISKLYTMPGLLRSPEWWDAAFPERGIFITYGEQETLSGEIEELYSELERHGTTTLDCEPDKLHSWPISQVFTGRTRYDRTKGINRIVGEIAHMVLWQCRHKN